MNTRVEQNLPAMKWTLKYVLCPFFFLFFLQVLHSQTELDNHKKYWFYKSRLNNDFMLVGNDPTANNFVVGDGHGQSLPQNCRHALGGKNNLNDPVRPQLHLDGGDAPTQLGVYLSVLATEYKLLKANNQDLTRINHEIFCALNAINRLDFHAESSLDATKQSNLNGFFIRDDTPERFTMNNYDHFNFFSFRINPITHDSSRVRGFCDSINGHVTRGNGTYPTSVSEPSQDHYYYLLMGLALTSKLVDANETDGTNVFGYGSGETRLATEAKNIANRLIKYLKTDPLWVIQNPNTNNTITGQGSHATPYAYALDNIGCFIKNGETMPYLHIPGVTGFAYPHNACFDYRNAYSLSPYAVSSWEILATGTSGGLTTDQMGFYQILAGIGNNVYESQMFLDINIQAAIAGIQSIISQMYANLTQSIQAIMLSLQSQNFVPQWLYNATQSAISALQLNTQTTINTYNSSLLVLQQNLTPSILTNTTDQRLLMNTKYSQVIYYNNCQSGTTPLVHQGSGLYFGTYLRDILYGYGSFVLPSNLSFIGSQPGLAHLIIKNDVRKILNEAPCEGNYHYGFDPATGIHANQGNEYWGAPNFIDRIDRMWLKAFCPEFRGDYAGLDYLLLHNLYYLVEGTNVSFEDYIDRTVTTNYPVGGSFAASNNPVMTKGAFEFVRPANTIGSNGAVVFRAGKEIIPVPGAFSVAQGADVAFAVDPYACSGFSAPSMNKSALPDAATDPFESETHRVTYIDPAPSSQKDIQGQISEEFMNNLKQENEKIVREAARISKILDDYNRITVFPNPSNGNFNLRFNLQREDNVNLLITNLLGEVVYEQTHITGEMSIPISLPGVSKGVYTAKIIFSDSREEIRKISIQ